MASLDYDEIHLGIQGNSEIAAKNNQLKARRLDAKMKRSHPATSVETLTNDTDRTRHCTEAFSTYTTDKIFNFSVG
jgi:hypothetical protein